MAVYARPLRGGQRPEVYSTPRRIQQRMGWLLMLAFVVALMTMLYLAQTGRVAALGFQIERLDVRKTELTRQNQQLMFEIEQAKSLENTRQRAMAMGFKPMVQEQARYITIEVPPQRWTAMAR